jgi:hypothetical protein
MGTHGESSYVSSYYAVVLLGTDTVKTLKKKAAIRQSSMTRREDEAPQGSNSQFSGAIA